MTLDAENLPTLRRELVRAQARYAMLIEAAEGDKYATDGKRQVSARELDEITNYIDELSYVLRRLAELNHADPYHDDDTRIGVPWSTILLIASINGGMLAIILYLLFAQGSIWIQR